MNRLLFLLQYSILLLKAFTVRRFVNLVFLRCTYFLSWCCNIHIFKARPAFLSVEPTNTCNLRCPECPTGMLSSETPKGFMSYDVYSHIIPQIAKHTWFVNLYFQGEPFLHTGFISMIVFAKKYNIVVSTSTNAQFITSENVNELVVSGIDKIIISLDGHSQEIYEMYRKNGSLEKVISALQCISEAKKKHGVKTPLVEVQCLLFKHTEKHTHEIKKLAQKHGANMVVFKTAQFYNPENFHMLPDAKNSRYFFNEQTQEFERKKPIKNKCWRMWSSVVITWNGTVIPCCFDKNSTYAYGSCEKMKYSEIIESDIAKKFKKTVHGNRKKIPMCKNCTS